MPPYSTLFHMSEILLKIWYAIFRGQELVLGGLVYLQGHFQLPPLRHCD